MDEKLQLKKVLNGNVAAFAYFVDTYQDMAISIAYRVCENRQDAEDIVQDAFVKAFHNLHTFRLDSKFSTWLYRIVYNTALSQIKTAHSRMGSIDYKEIDSSEDITDWDIFQQIQAGERKEAISHVLSSMPKDESVLLTLYYLDENSVKDVSLIIGLTEANVKVKLHRARKRFAQIFTEQISNEIF